MAIYFVCSSSIFPSFLFVFLSWFWYYFIQKVFTNWKLPRKYFIHQTSLVVFSRPVGRCRQQEMSIMKNFQISWNFDYHKVSVYQEWHVILKFWFVGDATRHREHDTDQHHPLPSPVSYYSRFVPAHRHKDYINLRNLFLRCI